MLPSSYPYDRKQLKAAWTAFVHGDTFPATPLDPAVKRSWLACRDAGLEPEAGPQPEHWDEEALEQRRQSCFDLIAIARPFMEDIYQFAGESDMIVYLTDEILCAVEWLGDETLGERLEGIGLYPGVTLTEERVGTNAAAMALSEGIPAQVVGPEHFCQDLHSFTDTAGPIHAPTGQMMGVIGIIARERKSHPHTLGIVMAAAKAIENQLQAELSLSEAHQHLTELGVSLQAMSKGIVFLDPQGKVTHINNSASDILNVPRRLAMGRRLSSLLDLPSEVRAALAERTPMPEKEVIFRADGKALPCLVNVDVLKPGDDLGSVLMLERIARARRLVHQMVGAKAHFTFDDIRGESVRMRRVLYYARTLAECESPLLLLGESGTGKECFAQAIHNASRYADGPFITVDCAAIPRELMAGELFGYEQTPSVADEEGRPGKIELAEGGTIFFDHVDSMPLNIQASILRVIDNKRISRLGGNRIIPVDVRIIAACNNLELEEEVEAGRFRADFYYRLHALTLTIPPLRERGNDILLLIAHLTEKFARRLEKEVKISSDAMGILQSYHWPGNIRELEDVLEWAIHMADGSKITLEHLPQELRRATIGGDGDQVVLTLQEAERQAIIRAGRALRGNKTKMAEALGIGRTTLWRKMKAYNLSADTFKRDDGAGELEA